MSTATCRWTGSTASGCLVWGGEIAGGRDSSVFIGRDPRTGEIKSQFPPDINIYFMHHRCYRSKATDRFLIPGWTGTEFVDFRKKHWVTNHWVRSGFTKAPVSANLKQAWKTGLGGRLSAPVIAGGKLLIASIDTHTVHALDADSGEPAWSYTAGGRVDSPPTVDGGRVLFGSADGYVYCLRLSDGALAWRFRAAPEERRMTSFEQVESVWPVHGSVLVRDGVVYMRSQRFDVEGKRFDVAPHTGIDAKQGAVQKGEGVHLFSPTDGNVLCFTGR